MRRRRSYGIYQPEQLSLIGYDILIFIFIMLLTAIIAKISRKLIEKAIEIKFPIFYSTCKKLCVRGLSGYWYNSRNEANRYFNRYFAVIGGPYWPGFHCFSKNISCKIIFHALFSIFRCSIKSAI